MRGVCNESRILWANVLDIPDAEANGDYHMVVVASDCAAMVAGDYRPCVCLWVSVVVKMSYKTISTAEYDRLTAQASLGVKATQTEGKDDEWECTNCGKTTTEFLTGPNPFAPHIQIVGCPHCRSPNTLVAYDNGPEAA